MTAAIESWQKRAREICDGWRGGDSSSEALMFAISITTAFYGPFSSQLEMLKARAGAITGSQAEWDIFQLACGAIKNTIAEIHAGLITSIRLNITGEVLAELTTLAQESLIADKPEVAAVLTAAAFEDCVRRLAQEKGAISSTNRIELSHVLTALKEKGVLQGGEVSLVQPFLKFRNDALHADWGKVKDTQTSSCLALVNSLIVKHLSGR